MSRFDFPIFDADNHLYEAEDALTRHLPAANKDLFRFVELKGRKKLVVRERRAVAATMAPARGSRSSRR